jgi:hypothetical protein
MSQSFTLYFRYAGTRFSDPDYFLLDDIAEVASSLNEFIQACCSAIDEDRTPIIKVSVSSHLQHDSLGFPLKVEWLSKIPEVFEDLKNTAESVADMTGEGAQIIEGISNLAWILPTALALLKSKTTIHVENSPNAMIVTGNLNTLAEKLANTPSVQKAAKEPLLFLKKEGVSTLEANAGNTKVDNPLAQIASSDVDQMIEKIESFNKPSITEPERKTFNIPSPDFEGQNWKLSSAEGTFMYKINDEDFLKFIRNEAPPINKHYFLTGFYTLTTIQHRKKCTYDRTIIQVLGLQDPEGLILYTPRS